MNIKEHCQYTTGNTYLFHFYLQAFWAFQCHVENFPSLLLPFQHHLMQLLRYISRKLQHDLIKTQNSHPNATRPNLEVTQIIDPHTSNANSPKSDALVSKPTKISFGSTLLQRSSVCTINVQMTYYLFQVYLKAFQNQVEHYPLHRWSFQHHLVQLLKLISKKLQHDFKNTQNYKASLS